MKSETMLEVAEALRVKALDAETAELDQYKYLAAYHCLMGDFKAAGQCMIQHKLVSEKFK